MADMTEPIPGAASLGGFAPSLVTPLPLFKDNRIDAATVAQQKLTNCPLPALLAAMAHALPDRLRAMIDRRSLPVARSAAFKNGTLTFTVDEVFEVSFPRRTIEISTRLYLDASAPTVPPRPRFAMATDGGGWVSYIEKAYVVYRCKSEYKNLDFLGLAATPLTVARVVWDVAGAFDWFRLTDRELWREVRPSSQDPPPGAEASETFDANEANIESFGGANRVMKRLRDIFGEHNARPTIVTTQNHTLAVVDYDDQSREVTFYDAMHQTARPPMHLREFLRSHDAVYQVR